MVKEKTFFILCILLLVKISLCTKITLWWCHSAGEILNWYTIFIDDVRTYDSSVIFNNRRNWVTDDSMVIVDPPNSELSDFKIGYCNKWGDTEEQGLGETINGKYCQIYNSIFECDV
jgi:hypothetical protein